MVFPADGRRFFGTGMCVSALLHASSNRQARALGIPGQSQSRLSAKAGRLGRAESTNDGRIEGNVPGPGRGAQSQHGITGRPAQWAMPVVFFGAP